MAMTAYADFEYYQDTYGGTAIALADFSALAIRASYMIDYLTLDRASDVIDADTPAADVTAIKLATCAIADCIQDINERSGQIQSEKVGGYSVTYTPTPTSSLSDDARMSLAAKRYLAKTGLMYRGFESGEYAGTAFVDDD
jgi:hypothetical protein